MNQVTFIFVNRNGANLWDAIHNVQSLYSDYTQDIIVAEQADELPFLRGQLFNIGVRYATGEYIALSDNDMFHLNKVPWIDIYDKVRCPLIGFKYISQVTLNDGRPTITSINECPTGFGGFNFMKKRILFHSMDFLIYLLAGDLKIMLIASGLNIYEYQTI